MRQNSVKFAIFLLILTLSVAAASQTASASLTSKNVQTWYSGAATYTRINSVAKGDLYGDGKVEIVTGGYYYDGTRYVAQLCVWDGTTLALKNIKTWYWSGNTYITSVVVGDVDGDGKVEIVTGGSYNDGTREVAQLCVWDGSTLALKNDKTWYWSGNTYITSVAVGDVDADGKTEIMTGGYYTSINTDVAQLCVWNGSTLALKNVQAWNWGLGTFIFSVAVGDVDADGKNEIVSGGYYSDGVRDVAQLCVWNGATLALKNVQTWYWGSGTFINSVAVGDVDADGKAEIMTGGWYNDGTRYVAQLCVWNGATLALKNVQTWYWTSSTYIFSVAVGDVDADGKAEIVTGGLYFDGTREIAQLCVWNGATIALKNVQTWYWTSRTYINSLTVGDVDADGKAEIMTGGYYYDGTRYAAQLCVWAG